MIKLLRCHNQYLCRSGVENFRQTIAKSHLRKSAIRVKDVHKLAESAAKEGIKLPPLIGTDYVSKYFGNQFFEQRCVRSIFASGPRFRKS